MAGNQRSVGLALAAVLAAMLGFFPARVAAQPDAPPLTAPLSEPSRHPAPVALTTLTRWGLVLRGLGADSSLPLPPQEASGDLVLPAVTAHAPTGHQVRFSPQRWQSQRLSQGWWRLSRRGQRTHLSHPNSRHSLIESDDVSVEALVDGQGRLRRLEGQGGPIMGRSSRGWREDTQATHYVYTFAYPSAGTVDLDMSLTSRAIEQEDGGPGAATPSRSVTDRFHQIVRVRGLQERAIAPLFQSLVLANADLSLVHPLSPHTLTPALQTLGLALMDGRLEALDMNVEIRDARGTEAQVTFHGRALGSADPTLTYAQRFSGPSGQSTEVASLRGVSAGDLVLAAARAVEASAAPESPPPLATFLEAVGMAVQRGPQTLTLHQYTVETDAGRLVAVADVAADGTPRLSAVRTGTLAMADILRRSLAEYHVMGADGDPAWVQALERAAQPALTADGQAASLWEIWAEPAEPGGAPVLWINGVPLFALVAQERERLGQP